MYELNIYDLALVSGGWTHDDAKEFVEQGTFWGGAAGSARGTYATAQGAAVGTVLAKSAEWTMYGASAYAGARIGTFLYDNSPTVRETAIGMMESFDLRYLGGRLGGRNNKSCNCGSACHCTSND